MEAWVGVPSIGGSRFLNSFESELEFEFITAYIMPAWVSSEANPNPPKAFLERLAHPGSHLGPPFNRPEADWKTALRPGLLSQ